MAPLPLSILAVEFAAAIAFGLILDGVKIPVFARLGIALSLIHIFVVFAAFTFGSFLVVKMIGFTLAVAVLIDATLVRIVIGPALLRIAGDWNWWPGGLATARKAPVTASRE